MLLSEDDIFYIQETYLISSAGVKLACRVLCKSYLPIKLFSLNRRLSCVEKRQINHFFLLIKVAYVDMFK